MPLNISKTFTGRREAGFIDATNKFNAAQKALHDVAEASKSVDQRVAYVPLTVQQYADRRLEELGDSYADGLDLEEQNALIASYRSANPAKRNAAKSALA